MMADIADHACQSGRERRVFCRVALRESFGREREIARLLCLGE